MFVEIGFHFQRQSHDCYVCIIVVWLVHFCSWLGRNFVKQEKAGGRKDANMSRILVLMQCLFVATVCIKVSQPPTQSYKNVVRTKSIVVVVVVLDLVVVVVVLDLVVVVVVLQFSCFRPP